MRNNVKNIKTIKMLDGERSHVLPNSTKEKGKVIVRDTADVLRTGNELIPSHTSSLRNKPVFSQKTINLMAYWKEPILSRILNLQSCCMDAIKETRMISLELFKDQEGMAITNDNLWTIDVLYLVITHNIEEVKIAKIDRIHYPIMLTINIFQRE